METSSSEKMNNVVGDDLSGDLGNKNRNTDDNSERCLTKDNKTDYTKEINESVNSQPAEEGYQGGEGIPEVDKDGVGIPEGDKDGGGIPEGDRSGGGIPEGNKDGVGIPEGDKGGVGIPEGDKGGEGIPEGDKDGGGIPEVDRNGGGIPEGNKDGVGIPEGDEDGVGTPKGDKDGVGIPEGDKGGGGIQEFDKEKQSESLRQKSDEDALIQNKDSQDNGTNITPNMNNDFDGNQYSHAVEVKDTCTTISVPGNLVIIDVTSENFQGSVQERHETGQSGIKMEDASEPTGTANGYNSPSKEREDALAALRQGQTYDEEEDFEEDYFDVEKFNKAREKYVYFWKNYDIYSQWHKSEFQVHGKKFCNAEQYMMFKKAELFEDREIANQVLKCKDPKKIKAFGRKVRGFNQEIWQQHCLYIVKEGNREKFLQNNDYLADLLLTYPKVLVEASPYDTIWGIGLTEDSPEAWDESTWHGSNYLGYVITEVRDDIMVERGMIEDEDRQKYIETLLAASGYAYGYDRDVEEGRARQGHAGHTDGNTEHDEHTKGHDAKKETYLLFSGGIYSQFYRSYFVVDDVEFSSAEQYMMYKKAMLFNDDKTAREMLAKTEPKKIKNLGRQVKGFDEEKWRKECLHIVKKGNMEKFSQNEKLRKAIVITYPKIFAEANHYDRIWGIGLKIKDPKAEKKHTWQGRNFLGYILTEVRDELLNKWGLLKEEKVSKYIEKLQKDWVDDLTKNDPNTTTPETDYPMEAKVDSWWENRHEDLNPRNKDNFSTEHNDNGKDARNTKHAVDHKKHNDDDDNQGNYFSKHVDDHKKHNDSNKEDSKQSSKQRGDHQHHGRNFKKNEEIRKETEDGNKSRTKDKDSQEKRNRSPLRNEKAIPKTDNKHSVGKEKDSSVKVGHKLATHADRDSTVMEKTVKSNQGTKKGKNAPKHTKDKGKQETIVEEFDIGVVMAAYSSNDQGIDKKPESPSNKTGSKKGQSQHDDTHSEEIHEPVTDRAEGMSHQKNTRRKKKNAKKNK